MRYKITIAAVRRLFFNPVAAHFTANKLTDSESSRRPPSTSSDERSLLLRAALAASLALRATSCHLFCVNYTTNGSNME